MSIWSSASNAISTTLDTVTDAATTAQETISMATDFVHNRAVEQKHTDRTAVVLRMSKTMSTMQEELDADPKLQTMFDDMSKLF